MTTGSAHYPPAAMCLSASSVSANYVHTVYTPFLSLACTLCSADSSYSLIQAVVSRLTSLLRRPALRIWRTGTW